MRIQHCGIDVGSKKLAVAVQWKGTVREKEFDNDPLSFEYLYQFLKAEDRETHAVFEGTGNYGLGIAVYLDQKGVSLMRVNPKAARSFAEAQMKRAKTDKVDAIMLMELGKTMEFVRWTAPKDAILELRTLAARMDDLQLMETAEKNRLHALLALPGSHQTVREDIEAQIAHLQASQVKLEERMLQLVRKEEELSSWYDAIVSIKGIAKHSGCMLIAALAGLPDDMTPRQVVAHAGLDPRPHESGKSNPARKISRIGPSALRSRLFFPAMVATRWEPAVNAFYHRLVDDKNKPRMLAIVAVMRKLLVVVWTMRRTRAEFDGNLFSMAA